MLKMRRMKPIKKTRNLRSNYKCFFKKFILIRAGEEKEIADFFNELGSDFSESDVNVNASKGSSKSKHLNVFISILSLFGSRGEARER